MIVLKALSALLTYPTQEMIAALPEIGAAVAASPLLPEPRKKAIGELLEHLAGEDLYEVQEQYGFLFDRTRSLSLHLFEHVHGESRDRGQAMVDLLKLYEEAGFSPVSNELPDYLPLFLEFASTRDPQAAIELIGQPAHVIAALNERLRKRKSPYAAVTGALLALARVKPDEAALAALRAEPDPEPDDLAALDAAWAEEEVSFGPAAAGDCGVDSLAAKLRAARRPAPDMPKAAAAPRPVITRSPAPRP